MTTPPPTPATPVGPYSPIRRVGELYFISGVIPLVPGTKTAAADIDTQTRQAFANLTAVLADAGLSLDTIVKTTVFLTDMADFAAMNAIYVEHFAQPRPARSCVGVSELPRVATVPLKIEIEAIATKPLE
ncbi:MAG TPA: Rid family detoxifying hydrolase [Candidatus Saccharimonadia bacterium]|nr:Rid family detoxifying hydrolase [Candidatus Saccharimonadia bacterium]